MFFKVWPVDVGQGSCVPVVQHTAFRKDVRKTFCTGVPQRNRRDKRLLSAELALAFGAEHRKPTQLSVAVVIDQPTKKTRVPFYMGFVLMIGLRLFDSLKRDLDA